MMAERKAQRAAKRVPKRSRSKPKQSVRALESLTETWAELEDVPNARFTECRDWCASAKVATISGEVVKIMNPDAENKI